VKRAGGSLLPGPSVLLIFLRLRVATSQHAASPSGALVCLADLGKEYCGDWLEEIRYRLADQNCGCSVGLVIRLETGPSTMHPAIRPAARLTPWPTARRVSGLGLSGSSCLPQRRSSRGNGSDSQSVRSAVRRDAGDALGDNRRGSAHGLHRDPAGQSRTAWARGPPRLSERPKWHAR
jgi:hypothetical protein